MTFEQLLYAEVLAQHHSMQTAADILHISKPGLSFAISQLEEELGIKMFERSSKGTQLTVEGKQMLSQIADILKSRNALENIAAEFKNAGYQHIRIHYMNVMMKSFIEPFINDYENEYTNLSLDISCHELNSITRNVRDHEIDAGFIAINDSYEDKIKDLKFTPVCHTNLSLMCAKNHILTEKKYITIEDLKDQRFCLYNDSIHDQIFDRLQSQCGHLNLVMRTDDSWAMTQALTKLNCVSFGRIVQSRLASDDHSLRGIKYLSLNHVFNDHFTLGWLTNPNYDLSDVAQKYLDKITTSIQKKVRS